MITLNAKCIAQNYGCFSLAESVHLLKITPECSQISQVNGKIKILEKLIS